MYHELGQEWIPNSRNKLFEKEESLFKKMTEVRSSTYNTQVYSNQNATSVLIG